MFLSVGPTCVPFFFFNFPFGLPFVPTRFFPTSRKRGGQGRGENYRRRAWYLVPSFFLSLYIDLLLSVVTS